MAWEEIPIPVAVVLGKVTSRRRCLAYRIAPRCFSKDVTAIAEEQPYIQLRGARVGLQPEQAPLRVENGLFLFP